MTPADGAPAASSLPLTVDLDGTLIATDMLHESALGLLRTSPRMTLSIPFWLARGKAALKAELARRFDFDPALLPFNEPFVAWLRAERSRGRRLILATASDARIATAIADVLGLFDETLASDGSVNLGGAAKAEALVGRFGKGGFAYAGNAAADLPVWREAGAAVVVNASAGLADKVSGLCPVEREFQARPLDPMPVPRMLRLHQWLKNLLVFVPLGAAHQMGDADRWPAVLMCFLAFCLCASSVYLISDLLDLESDRRHPRKRWRALASGAVSIRYAALLSPVLFLCSMGLGIAAGLGPLAWLCAYFVVTCAYSLRLKRVAVLDCMVLALLYSLRVVAGGAAAAVPLSHWLLAFSAFMFLSLAFVKRYAELQSHPPDAVGKLHGRGYGVGDARLVLSLGVASGIASALVLSLYLNSETVVRLYPTPGFIWACVPVLLYWIGHMWLTAHRGLMHDDPLVFAVKDGPSLAAGALFVAALVAGGVAW